MRETNTTSLLRAGTQAEEDALAFGTAFIKVSLDESGRTIYEALDPTEVIVRGNPFKDGRQPTDRQYPDWERGKYPFSSHHRLSEGALHPSMMEGEWA